MLLRFSTTYFVKEEQSHKCHLCPNGRALSPDQLFIPVVSNPHSFIVGTRGNLPSIWLIFRLVKEVPNACGREGLKENKKSFGRTETLLQQKAQSPSRSRSPRHSRPRRRSTVCTSSPFFIRLGSPIADAARTSLPLRRWLRGKVLRGEFRFLS